MSVVPAAAEGSIRTHIAKMAMTTSKMAIRYFLYRIKPEVSIVSFPVLLSGDVCTPLL